MATCFALLSADQVLEPVEMLKVASGGLAPSEVIEVAVKPAGFPLWSVRVITDTPEACLLNTARSASVDSVTGSKLFITLFLFT